MIVLNTQNFIQGLVAHHALEASICFALSFNLSHQSIQSPGDHLDARKGKNRDGITHLLQLFGVRLGRCVDFHNAGHELAFDSLADLLEIFWLRQTIHEQDVHAGFGALLPLGLPGVVIVGRQPGLVQGEGKVVGVIRDAQVRPGNQVWLVEVDPLELVIDIWPDLVWLLIRGGQWVCSVGAIGLYTRLREIRGEDSLQTLLQAVKFLRRLIEYFIDDGGSLLSPDDETPVKISDIFI